MVTFLVVVQVVVALLLILVVLLQPGNKGGVSAALGGAGGETVFGGRGANTFLAKLTLGAAVLFMVTSLALSFLSTPRGSVLDTALKDGQKTGQDFEVVEDTEIVSESESKNGGGEKGDDFESEGE